MLDIIERNEKMAAGADSHFSESMKEYYRYQKEQDRKEKEVQFAQEQALYAKQEYERLRKRRSNCCVAGAIIAGLILIIIFPAMRSGGSDAVSLIMTNPLVIPSFAFLGALVFFLPFGFLPIKDFIARRGAFIVFTWVFLVILSAFVLTFAMFAGLPYFFYLQSRIKTVKRDAEALQAQAETITANYAQA